MKYIHSKISLEKIIFFVIVLFVLYLIYSFVYKNKVVEQYYYTVNNLKQNSNIQYIKQNETYTNHIHANLYNNNGEKCGVMRSINHHEIIDGINNVNTVSTFKTKRGTITFNLFYETSPDNHYLYGNISDVLSENESGYYNGKKVSIQIEGKYDGKRLATITSENTLF